MKKILLSVVVLVVGAYFLEGCATTPPLPTKTGKPDVTIQASNEEVFNSVTDELLTVGYMLRNVNETKNIAIYTIQHPEMTIVYEDMPVDEQVTINLVPTSTGVRMLGSISYIGYPGTSRQRVVKPGFDIYEREAQDNQKLYSILLKVKQTLENK